MDRQIIYPGQIPLDTDQLHSSRHAVEGLGCFISAVMGQSGVTVIDGMECKQETPASMNVLISPGTIMTEAALDSATYGTLPAMPARHIMQQGMLKETQIVPITAPSVVGQSINYLIQVGFAQVDEDPIVLPYYNADNPDQPYSGPENSGIAQMTVRRGLAVVTAKAGVPATTGSQSTPAPDPGNSPLYVVTVAYGATTITSANITVHPDAKFLISKLPRIPFDTQSGMWIYGVAGGTANALTVDLFPKPDTYPKAMIVLAVAGNTGPATINPNGLGAVPIVQANGDPLVADMIVPGVPMLLIRGASAYFLMNVNTSLFDPETPPDRNITNVGKETAVSLYIGIDGVTGNYQLRKVRSKTAQLVLSVDPDGEVVIDADALVTSAQVVAPIFPEIETADNRLVLTGSTGQVVINPGQTFIHRGGRRISTSDYSQMARTLATAPSKTYHLRWQWNNGSPQFVLKDCADAGYTGGATEDDRVLDTTYDDMLIARIVTSAGNVPTITALANKAILRAMIHNEGSISGGVGNGKSRVATETYNWARTPDIQPNWTKLSTGVSGSTEGNLDQFPGSATHDHDERMEITALSRYGWSLYLMRDYSLYHDIRVLMIA